MSESIQQESLSHKFTKQNRVAVLIIALLATVAFFSLYIGLKSSESTAYIINLSGKQRMLSQRIASLAQQYYLITYDSKNLSNIQHDEFISTLQTAMHQMRSNNNALSSGNLDNSRHVELSQPIREYYFGDTNLKRRVDTYLLLNEKLLQSTSKSEALELLPQILSLSNTLLPDLMDAVLQYQKEGEENIGIIRNIAMTAWILILFALLLEMIFIFQPITHNIQKLFEEVSWNQKNLKQQVKIRTLSLEQANLKLLHMASHDPLTGLKNRLNLEKDLERLLIHHQEHHAPFAVAILDIDWFKKINDDYGHDAGDFVLREIAKILTDNVREEDSVYRSGGEEFVILFNRITQEEALNRTDKIRLKIQEHLFSHNEYTIHLTISGGLYHPDHKQATNVQEVLKCSDVALYDAKRLGRNKIMEVEKTKE
ncbi:MAG: diguanylate cyclase [Sulfuricurvum sp.]|nr:diguanylate cyclase [Sulfuricurvum sp.]